jgi:hypothetical protein
MSLRVAMEPGLERIGAECGVCGADAVTWQWAIEEFSTVSPWDAKREVEFQACVWLCGRCRDDLTARRPDWASQRVYVAWQRIGGSAKLDIDDEAALLSRIQVVVGTIRDRWTGEEASVEMDNGVPIVGDFTDVLHLHAMNLVDESDAGWRMDKPDPPSIDG